MPGVTGYLGADALQSLVGDGDLKGLDRCEDIMTASINRGRFPRLRPPGIAASQL